MEWLTEFPAMDKSAAGLYKRVIDDVIKQTRDQVLVGLDEHTVDMTIERLITLWEQGLSDVRALDVGVASERWDWMVYLLYID